ncbi:MAG: proline iminopeptidase-family hydrolase [Bacilli bacterium]|jgi:proline iminopeptidase
MNIKDGYLDFEGHKTYYRIASPEKKKTPLLILHGGPGSTHNSYELLDNMSELDDRPIVTYDQIGCGLSSVEGFHPELYNKETWVRELTNLREKLHLTKVHLMGHSWGGMLAIIYLTDYNPAGIVDVNLSSTLSSASLWSQETHRLLRYLNPIDRQAIEKAEKSNDYSSLEFDIANKHYLKLYVADPDDPNRPECLTRPKVIGTESYEVAWGPCEYTPLGNLRDYEYTDKLSKISCPVLFCSGANDESTPLMNKTMFEKIRTEKKWVLFSKSRHMTYYEENEKYEQEVMSFMDSHDERK